jgi:hypothetical protein
MGGVRARALVVSALAALACAVSAPAHAASAPCWKTVFNEWSRTNKISATYPLHCYHDALAHLKDFPDADIYSSFADDVHSALAAAIARRAHKQLPEAYLKQLRDAKKGKGAGTTSTPTTSTSRTTSTTAIDPSGSPDDGGGGIPTPLLVLGAVALVLLAAGAIGGAVRFNRARRGA